MSEVERLLPGTKLCREAETGDKALPFGTSSPWTEDSNRILRFELLNSLNDWRDSVELG